jgi:hypothetical protein
MIRFACPTCGKVLKAPDRASGQKLPCPRCGQRLQVPPPVQPLAPNKTVLGELVPELESRAAAGPEPPGPPQLSPNALAFDEPGPDHLPTRPAPTTLETVARLALACVGALLLIAGQFCPMLTGPRDSVSFLDYSVRIAWVLSKAAGKVLDAAGDNSDEEDRARPVRRPERRPQKVSEALRTTAAVVGLVLTVLSPVCLLILVGTAVRVLLAAVQRAGPFGGGLSGRRLANSGALCLLALAVLFLGFMLMHWAELAPPVLDSFSFGFGWGVLLTGGVALLMGGKVG